MALQVMRIPLLLLASLILLIPLASLTALEAPSAACPITFGRQYFSGSGCAEPGSVTWEIYPSDGRISFKFLNYVAQVGDRFYDYDAIRSCDIILDVTYPRGCVYSGGFVVDRRGRGYMDSPAVFSRMEFSVTMSGTDSRWDHAADGMTGPSPNYDTYPWDRHDEGQAPSSLWWSMRNGGTGTIKLQTSIQCGRNQGGANGWQSLEWIDLRFK